MRLFAIDTAEPAKVEIPPGADLGTAEPPNYESKRKAALAFLGEKWCLAPTRADQLKQIRDNGEDLA